jgi:D-glycero-D-manno-heptose 1,7-bisphosphate phosphatase
MNTAIFLDRDGVLIEDVDLLTNPRDIRVLEGVPQALRRLKEDGFRLIVVSNQTVVARGLATEEEVLAIQAEVERFLEQVGAPRLDGFYFCPHHPNATLPAYRTACECRKPRPGLLLRAAREHNLNLDVSFAVGDRITDIIAGARAGCWTVLVQTGKHQASPIETVEPLDESVQPDYVCTDLRAAAGWILALRPFDTTQGRRGLGQRAR